MSTLRGSRRARRRTTLGRRRRASAGWATRVCSTASRAMVPEVDVVAIFNANTSRIEVMEEIAGRRARRRAVARVDLREAARAQPRRSAPGGRAGRRDRCPDRVLREPDPHEDAAARARAARRVGGDDGSAHARARGGGARRPAQRRGSGIRPSKAAVCSPTWAATASRWAGTCSRRRAGRRASSNRRRCRRTRAC